MSKFQTILHAYKPDAARITKVILKRRGINGGWIRREFPMVLSRYRNNTHWILFIFNKPSSLSLSLSLFSFLFFPLSLFFSSPGGSSTLHAVISFSPFHRSIYFRLILIPFTRELFHVFWIILSVTTIFGHHPIFFSYFLINLCTACPPTFVSLPLSSRCIAFRCF